MTPLARLAFEAELDNRKLCRVLGVRRQHMNHFHAGRPVPAYVQAHIDTLLLLPADVRARVILEHLSREQPQA